MKGIPFTLHALLLSAASFAFAANPIPGFYIGVLAGGTYAPSVNGTLFNPYTGLDDQGRFTYSFGGNVGAYLGYRCGNYLFEGEFLYNLNQFDKFESNATYYNRFQNANVIYQVNNHVGADGLKLGGETKTFAGFVNVKYELYQQGSDANFIPYAGLGIGLLNVRNTKELYCQPTEATGGGAGATQCQQSGNANAPIFWTGGIKSSGSTVAGQGIIGASYFLDDFTSFAVDARYIGTAKMGAMDNSSMGFASINLSLNYSLETFKTS